ncbi:MAG: DUF4843 domain-containing protein [Prevotella sp.]|nr:DUF4843 domain-containing protein [Prevotella sp.]
MITKINNKVVASVLSCLLVSIVMVLTGCENELPVYDNPHNSLNFAVTLDEETGSVIEKNYSFVYAGDAVQTDTIWITVNTQGFLSDADRPFQLQQITAGEGLKDAEAGVHYERFDSETMRTKLFIPAKAYTQKFPVVVYRDASLAEGDVHLYFQIKPNEHFEQGLIPYRTVKLAISNSLKRPEGWEEYYFGTYGPVKHKFMIDETGLRWDDEFCSNLTDFGYIQYFTMMLHQRLQVVNAERKKQGLDILKEANGKAIKFDFGASF